MNPLIGGALISAGSSILGGLFGRKSQNKADDQNAALQREFAKNSIQWRVKDAQAAGISPLAALGASTTSAAPSYVGGNIGNAVTRAGSRIGQAVGNSGQAAANIDNTRASTDLIQQQILASKQAMALEAANRTQDTGDFNVVPDQVIQHRKGDPSTSAGPGHPGWKNVNVGGGIGTLDIPGDELNEVLEAPAAWPLVYAANKGKLDRWAISGMWKKYRDIPGRPAALLHAFGLRIAKKLKTKYADPARPIRVPRITMDNRL